MVIARRARCRESLSAATMPKRAPFAFPAGISACRIPLAQPNPEKRSYGRTHTPPFSSLIMFAMRPVHFRHAGATRPAHIVFADATLESSMAKVKPPSKAAGRSATVPRPPGNAKTSSPPRISIDAAPAKAPPSAVTPTKCVGAAISSRPVAFSLAETMRPAESNVSRAQALERTTVPASQTISAHRAERASARHTEQNTDATSAAADRFMPNFMCLSFLPIS